MFSTWPRMFRVAVVGLGCWSTLSFANNADITAVQQVLEQQRQAWNQGDIPRYMQGYWQSEQLTFVGSNGVTRGWQATLARYQHRYPTPVAMGQLQFDVLETQQLDATHIYMIGRWALKRDSQDVAGHFSLLWQKMDGQWRIVSDHSS